MMYARIANWCSQKKYLGVAVGLIVFFIGVLSLCELLWSFYLPNSHIAMLDDAPSAPVALVFGAGLRKNGTPSDVLQDRIDTAIALYQDGRVKKLLMSGDNGQTSYDEVTAMRAYALARGVPSDDIILDYAGFRTLDTCARAAMVFGVEEVLAVSQAFHLPRIVFLCESYGIKTTGIIADRQEYLQEEWFVVRERLAQLNAWLDRRVLFTQPKFPGPPEPIIFD
jgi:vancomycin permeability regulator SanA